MNLLFAALLSFAPAAPKGPSSCVDIGTLVDAQTMESTRTGSWTNPSPNKDQGWDLLVLFIKLTDADTSIARFDVTCTVSEDGNTTNYTPQEDTVASGTATQTDAGVWQKASPGSKNWPIRMNIKGFPDFECSFAVGSGTGGSADLLTVEGRLCAE